MRPRSGPIAVVGAHAAGLFMHVTAVPREGETVLGFGFDEPEDGGKATNQAIAAARLGAPVAIVTVLGRDERGRRARAWLDRDGVDTRWVVEVDGPTDTGFVMLPPSRIPAITTAQDRSRELDARAVAGAAALIDEASLVVCQLEAPHEAALAAFRLARRAGATTVLNPAPPAELVPELLDLTDVLVPNEHEAAVLAGAPAPPAALAEELARRLPRAVVAVTAGAEGVHVAGPGVGAFHVPAPRVEVADTTGAGDAFVAALAVRLRETGDVSEAAAFAVRAASLSVTRPGTIPAYARRGDLDPR